MNKMKPLMASLAIILLASVFVSAGAITYFSDTEDVIATFEAGQIDLKLDYVNPDTGLMTWYNGTELPLIYLDVKPSDWLYENISIHLYDNDAWLYIKFDVTDYENGINEPESDVDNTLGDIGSSIYPGKEGGELSQYLELTVSVQGPDGEIHYWAGLASQIPEIWLGPAPMTTCVDYFFIVSAHITTTAGNVIQTDVCQIDVDFYAVQQRNNDNPVSPGSG